MRKAITILLILVLALPALLLPGNPSAAPAWFGQEMAGVPGVIWFVMAWFAVVTFASWLPLGGDEGR